MPLIIFCKVTAHLSGLSILDHSCKAIEFNGFLSDQVKDTFLDHFSDLGCLFAWKTKIVPISCIDKLSVLIIVFAAWTRIVQNIAFGHNEQPRSWPK